MTSSPNRVLSALALGALLAFGSAHAADDGKKAPETSDRASQKAERRDAPRKETGRTQKELNTCKQEAQGKDGPERANFMTDCLKNR